MLSHLIYTSDAVNIREPDLQAILAAAEKNNPALGITGLMMFSSNTFVQLLEGSKKNVNLLYNTIVQDKRYKNTRIIKFDQVDYRICTDWNMAYLANTEKTRQIALKYSPEKHIDFEVMTDCALVMFIEDLANYFAAASP